jgi:hypothetical protein
MHDASVLQGSDATCGEDRAEPFAPLTVSAKDHRGQEATQSPVAIAEWVQHRELKVQQCGSMNRRAVSAVEVFDQIAEEGLEHLRRRGVLDRLLRRGAPKPRRTISKM